MSQIINYNVKTYSDTDMFCKYSVSRRVISYFVTCPICKKRTVKQETLSDCNFRGHDVLENGGLNESKFKIFADRLDWKDALCGEHQLCADNQMFAESPVFVQCKMTDEEIKEADDQNALWSQNQIAWIMGLGKYEGREDINDLTLYNQKYHDSNSGIFD